MSQSKQSTPAHPEAETVSEDEFALSPPPALYADEADEALAVTKFQQELLDRAEHYLKRLRLLAAISLEAENPDRNLLNTEFRELEDGLAKVLSTKLNDKQVFRRRDYAVRLEQRGNKLILPGVHSLRGFLPKLQQANILAPETAKEALQVVKTAFKHVAIDEAISIENNTRLTFLTRHFDEIRETL